jgi:hypothetical protein
MVTRDPTMAVLGLWVINKAGGLVYQKDFNGECHSSTYESRVIAIAIKMV